MSLRWQLLVIVLIALVLPVAGWYTAREVEAALRNAEARAQIAVAQALVRSLDPQPLLAASRGQQLYVHRISYPISVDGFDDDWRPFLPWSLRFASPRHDLRLELLLARDARRLYGLAIVSESTRRPGDHLLLNLGGDRRLAIYPGIPGRAEIRALSAGGHIPTSAAWEPYGPGRYLVEFAVPASMVPNRLGVAVVDVGENLPGREPAMAGIVAGEAPVTLPLTTRSSVWSQRLAAAAPEGARLWLIDDQAWVLAGAGELAMPAQDVLGGWRALVYRWLSDVTPTTLGRREPAVNFRLEGAEIDTALNGRPGVRLGQLPNSGAVAASTAVPVVVSGRVVGALVLETSSDALMLAANRAFAGTVLVSTLVVIVLTAGLLGLSALLSLRIRRLRDATDAVAAGELNAFPVSTAGDEIGDLSRSFSALLAELGEYNRYLQSLAGRLAHELGTPLAVVRSSLENLQETELPAVAQPYLERARDGADRLRAILRAMSEARRLEQAVAEADLERTDVVNVVSGCFAAYREMDPNHSWQLTVQRERFLVRGSPELIAQALDKLTDNARSFAPAGGRIEVLVETRGRGVAVRVINEGPPLPARMGGRLFESMVSVRERPGFHLGLGLHIVRLVARAHGGRVTARNSTDPPGAEFTLWLPGE